MTHDPKDFVGSWDLITWSITYPDGRVTHPFGADPVGQLLYAADGGMSATVARRDRPRFDPDIARATADQRLRAFASYFHYSGNWTLAGGTVHHAVAHSLNPDMVGTAQIRNAEFAGDCLILSADEADAMGRVRHHRLVWQHGV